MLDLKRAKTTKEHSQEHSKKTSNENSSTISAHKNAASDQKAKEKRQTPGKNYFERKAHSG